VASLILGLDLSPDRTCGKDPIRSIAIDGTILRPLVAASTVEPTRVAASPRGIRARALEGQFLAPTAPLLAATSSDFTR
jgi:hypothetical protein